MSWWPSEVFASLLLAGISWPLRRRRGVRSASSDQQQGDANLQLRLAQEGVPEMNFGGSADAVSPAVWE